MTVTMPDLYCHGEGCSRRVPEGIRYCCVLCINGRNQHVPTCTDDENGDK